MIDPAALARHYSRFRVTERILLTGHSHQAWPDVAFEAQQQAWLDAAEQVDGKWDLAAEQAGRVQEGFARLLGDAPAHIALGQNTHELVVRWLSALPLRDRRQIVTTDGEFGSWRRQADRLAEEPLEIARVHARPADSLAERLAAVVSERTAGVVVSSVLFDSAEVVPHLSVVAAKCERLGVQLLVDAYHHLNAVPFDIGGLGLERAFVTGGGYKYCQLGEGNAFLRVPPGQDLRPVITGWFAEAGLETPGVPRLGSGVSYAAGARAFAGATYDPTSHYRAAAVFAFHHREALSAEQLRATNRRQVQLLREEFEQLDVDPRIGHVEPMPDDRRGGFLALRTARGAAVAAAARREGLFVDARGPFLRVGPAPYVTNQQLRDGVRMIGQLLRSTGRLG
jgi:kynureninase